jgi:hypothetical protein
MASWDDDLHTYSELSLPFKTTVLQHMPLQLNFAYSEPNAATQAAGKRAGHLVTVEYTGLSDPSALLDSLTLDQYIEFEKHNMEHKAILLDRISRERGYLVKMISMRDMTGMGYKHVGGKGVTIMTSVLKMMQGAYPEVIENIFIINAPWIFATLWGLVKPFVAPRTIEKIKIFGASSEKGAKELLVARIGAHNLPERFGGSRKDIECLPAKVLAADGVSVPADHDSRLRGPPPPPPLIFTPRPPPASSVAAQTATTESVATEQTGGGGGGGTSFEDDFGTNPLSMAAEASIDAEIAKLAASAKTEGGFVQPIPEEAAPAETKHESHHGCQLAEVMESTFEIPPGAKHEIFLDIVCHGDSKPAAADSAQPAASVVIAWSFDIISFLATTDVGFSVLFEARESPESPESSSQGHVVKSFERVSCDAASPLKGKWTTDRSGTLIIAWDNTYSLFMAKELHHRIEVWEGAAIRKVESRRVTSKKKDGADSQAPDTSSSVSSVTLPSMFSWKSTQSKQDETSDSEKKKEGVFWDISIDMSLPSVLTGQSSDEPAKDSSKSEDPSFWDRMTSPKT